MGLINEIAMRTCEKYRSRQGCFDAHMFAEKPCDTCQARGELGLAHDNPRVCEHCGAILVMATKVDIDTWTGRDRLGSETCPPPAHKPALYADELPEYDR